MSYTVSNGQPQGKVYWYTNAIREDMISEIIAINGYEKHIATYDNKEINEIWHHIVEDEKEHYGIFLELLRKMDPVQYNKYKYVKGHLKLESKSKNIKNQSKNNKDQSKNSNRLLFNAVREDIKGELEAVILYEQHVIQIPYFDVKKIYRDIVSDEKEHLEELTAFLVKYDVDKYGPLNK